MIVPLFTVSCSFFVLLQKIRKKWQLLIWPRQQLKCWFDQMWTDLTAAGCSFPYTHVDPDFKQTFLTPLSSPNFAAHLNQIDMNLTVGKWLALNQPVRAGQMFLLIWLRGREKYLRGQIFVFSRGDILICGRRYGQFGGAKVAPDETAETNCKWPTKISSFTQHRVLDFM